MCQYSYEDGISNNWQVVHLGARAVGGAGLIIAEATAVESRGRITPHDVGIWSDEHVEPLARVAETIKANGVVAGIQISHAGRKANTSRPWDGGAPLLPNDPRFWPVVGPSPIPFNHGYQTPQELTKAEILELVSSFRSGAGRVLAAGFEWLEIHGAHGYLINNFLSPISNQRKDEYGGSFENRVRFLIEIVRAVREIWPERLPLTVRLSGSEWVDGGWDVPDTVALARLLKSEGVDLIDCSSGGNVINAPIPVGAGYQVPIAEAVRSSAGIPTAAVGMITSAMQADEIIRNGRADVVLLAREMLRDPYWPLHAAQILKQPAPVPPQYLRAF
jgi:2,4-dienoyl-CoA reductase-like NADH-dependent reductase (Old Yellow Enzyme family)